jgi:8-oxo-dGTP diphosphatase
MSDEAIGDSTSSYIPNPYPTVGVSVVIFSLRPSGERGQELAALLARRAAAPYAGSWALPGGWVRTGEGLEEAARRQLATRTGLKPAYLEQLYTFGRPERDPREHRIAVAYYALIRSGDEELRAGGETAEVRWFGVGELPEQLAFDHREILDYALWRLRNKLSYARVAYQFLPPEFTLAQLRAVYEVITGKKVDPANFRRRVETSGDIVPTGRRVEGEAHRPPQIYRLIKGPDEWMRRPDGYE